MVLFITVDKIRSAIKKMYLSTTVSKSLNFDSSIGIKANFCIGNFHFDTGSIQSQISI